MDLIQVYFIYVFILFFNTNQDEFFAIICSKYLLFICSHIFSSYKLVHHFSITRLLSIFQHQLHILSGVGSHLLHYYNKCLFDNFLGVTLPETKHVALM